MAKGLYRKCRFPYDEDYNPSSFGLDNFEPVLTKQADASAADINLIVRKWQNNGVIPTYLNEGIAQFADVSEMPDYRGALDLVARANALFQDLPAVVRSEFNNDPAFFLDFCQDPRNGEELVRLGLATKRVEPSTDGSGARPTTLAQDPAVGGSTEAGTASEGVKTPSSI